MNERYINQQTVTIHKQPISQCPQFITMNIQSSRKAMRSLSGCAYKIYVFLCENKDNYQFPLSKKIISSELGISERSYTNAKKELIEKGYLVKNESNNLDFYDEPKRQKLPYP